MKNLRVLKEERKKNHHPNKFIVLLKKKTKKNGRILFYKMREEKMKKYAFNHQMDPHPCCEFAWVGKEERFKLRTHSYRKIHSLRWQKISVRPHERNFIIPFKKCMYSRWDAPCCDVHNNKNILFPDSELSIKISHKFFFFLQRFHLILSL